MADKEQINLEEALRKAAPQGKISCEVARSIAERLNLPYALVGETANELGIKIWGCQLGCF